MGLRLTTAMSVALTTVLLIVAALFAWRVYRSLLHYGWF
jgi:hypothetical protein